MAAQVPTVLVTRWYYRAGSSKQVAHITITFTHISDAAVHPQTNATDVNLSQTFFNMFGETEKKGILLYSPLFTRIPHTFML